MGCQCIRFQTFHMFMEMYLNRRLTVGEISANWANGACLRDTLRVKYNVARKDPLPIIRETISQILKQEFVSFCF